MNKLFEIGEWVSDGIYIGQVLSIRNLYVEKYTADYFEDKKLGSFKATLATIKVLCETDGKIKKRDRIASYNMDYFKQVNQEESTLIQSIKSNQPEEYEKYILYDQKKDIFSVSYIGFSIVMSELDNIQEKIQSILQALPNAFTLTEFIKESQLQKLPLDFDTGTGSTIYDEGNFELQFINSNYRVINKKRIFTNVLTSVKR